MTTTLTAQWSISLDTECPACQEHVDLLTYPDFFDGRHLDVCENMTERSRCVEVICPECGQEFKVDLTY